MEDLGVRFAEGTAQRPARPQRGKAADRQRSGDRERSDMDPFVEARLDRLIIGHEEVDPVAPLGEERDPAARMDAVRVAQVGEGEGSLEWRVQCYLLLARSW